MVLRQLYAFFIAARISIRVIGIDALKKKALVIVGPTASGKTDVSLSIADDMFEIVSVDSAQVYRFMDIGTGKVSPYHRSLITHYCIDTVNPDYWFTAGDFCREAGAALHTIHARKKLPMFVGGTGLYIQSFFYGLVQLPSIDASIKQQLRHDLQQEGLTALYGRLTQCDPHWASRIHPHDTQRIMRGLEVFMSAGIPLSSYFQSEHSKAELETLIIAVDVDRKELYQRIDNRVDAMIQNGFVEEVEKLRSMGYTSELNSQKAIGYFHIHKFLNNQLSLPETIAQIKQETKHYAKRQITWFKRYNPLRVRSDDSDKIKQLVQDWLESG